MPHAPLTRLDRYRLDAVLGAGGMGPVYRGFDETIDRVVAVKVIHPHLLDSDVADELEQRFRQEARAAARCMHPNIVTVFDYGFDANMSYLVMEYVEGVELKALLRRELGLDTVYRVAIAGAGNLGRALTLYPSFIEAGFDVVAIFDSDPGKIGDKLSSLVVQSIDDLEWQSNFIVA